MLNHMVKLDCRIHFDWCNELKQLKNDIINIFKHFAKSFEANKKVEKLNKKTDFWDQPFLTIF